MNLPTSPCARHFREGTLDAGFTTVRDLGAGDIQAIFALEMRLQKAISTDSVLLWAKRWPRRADMRILPTGFGLTYEVIGPKQGVINGPDDALKLCVSATDGSDVVKLTVTGGVLSLAKSG